MIELTCQPAAARNPRSPRETSSAAPIVTRGTIAASGAEVVVDASPARLDRFLELAIPTVRVRYRFEQRAGPPLLELVAAAVARGRGMP